MSHFIVLRRNKICNIRAIYDIARQRVYSFMGLRVMEATALYDVDRYSRLINMKCYAVDTLPADYKDAINKYLDSHDLDGRLV